MNQTPIQCLILACGNTLREDDGVGPFLAQWAEEHWRTIRASAYSAITSGHPTWHRKSPLPKR